MGREVRRVDINNPPKMNQVWEGFINPYYKRYTKDCPDCKNGYPPEAKQFQDEWYGYKMGPKTTRVYSPDHPFVIKLAMRNTSHSFQEGIDFERNQQFRKKFLQERFRLAELFSSRWGYSLDADDIAALRKANRLDKYFDDKPDATPDEVNDFYLEGFGHDGINSWVCIRARCEKEGVPSSCPTCNGQGHIWTSEEGKKLYEEWEPTEPPTGEAYQIWETVSEGAPISPAFLDPEELAEWMSLNATWKLDQGTPKETWLKFILGPGWAPSAMGIPGQGLVSGVVGITSQDE